MIKRMLTALTCVLLPSLLMAQGVAPTTQPYELTPNSVSNSKLAPMMPYTVKGNNGAATASPSDIPLATLLASVQQPNLGLSGASNLSSTGSASAGSTALTLTSAIDFANGQGIRINHAGAAFTLNQPTAMAVTPAGTTGTTTYQYKIAPLDNAGGVGAATAVFQTTTGNSTLGVTNYNSLTWTAPSGTAPVGYAVYRSIAGVYTLIGAAVSTGFNDYGYTAWPYADWLPTTAQATALPDYLVTTVASGGGTTSLVLSTLITTAVTSVGVLHDNTVAIQTAVNSESLTAFPSGTYLVSGTINMPNNVTLLGSMYGTIIRNVNFGQTVFNLGQQNQINGLTFNLMPNSTALLSTQSYNFVDNIQCLGSEVGMSYASNCLNMYGNHWFNGNNIVLEGWSASIGQGSGGMPPRILVGTGTTNTTASTGVYLSRLWTGNSGSQPLVNSLVTYNNAYNAVLSDSYFNAEEGLGKSAAAVQIMGLSQVVNIVGNNFLNYQANIRMDSWSGGNPITVNITNNHFDFCTPYCILLQGGSWVNITGNSFAGEYALAGQKAIHFSSSFTNGPNVISSNTFDGWAGTGSFAISLPTMATNTTVIGNQFTNLGGNNPFTGGADGLGTWCGAGSPTSSHTVNNGVVTHC